MCKALNCYAYLKEQGVVAAYYHAGMSPSARKQVYSAFLGDKVHIVVATVAFGMGIHKEDIRLIVHLGKQFYPPPYH